MKKIVKIPSTPPLRTLIWRGVKGKCPACGKTQLFKSYLKPIEFCSNCGTDFSVIQTEDGPAWLTIFLLGPILIPMMTVLAIGNLPSYIIFPIMTVVIITAVLLLLPRVKGGFLAALYSIK